MPCWASTASTSTWRAPSTTIRPTDMNGECMNQTTAPATPRAISSRRRRPRLERALSSATRRRRSARRRSISIPILESHELDLRFEADPGLLFHPPLHRLDETTHGLGGRLRLRFDEVGVPG